LRVRGLAYVSLYADDLQASRRFYGDLLGLPVVDEGDWGLVLRAGPVDVFVHSRGDAPTQHVEMTFDVRDVDAAIDTLRAAGVPVVDEPADREWSDRDGAVADPDGKSSTFERRRRSAPRIGR
jgi:lactoylglutathione lyase